MDKDQRHYLILVICIILILAMLYLSPSTPVPYNEGYSIIHPKDDKEQKKQEAPFEPSILSFPNSPFNLSYYSW